MYSWYVLFREDSCPTEFFGHNNEREARAAARRWLGIARLPQGTQVWKKGK